MKKINLKNNTITIPLSPPTTTTTTTNTNKHKQTQTNTNKHKQTQTNKITNKQTKKRSLGPNDGGVSFYKRTALFCCFGRFNGIKVFIRIFTVCDRYSNSFFGCPSKDCRVSSGFHVCFSFFLFFSFSFFFFFLFFFFLFSCFWMSFKGS